MDFNLFTKQKPQFGNLAKAFLLISLLVCLFVSSILNFFNFESVYTHLSDLNPLEMRKFGVHH